MTLMAAKLDVEIRLAWNELNKWNKDTPTQGKLCKLTSNKKMYTQSNE